MDKNITYEKAMEELDKVVNALENGDTSLDEALSLYEKGVELTKFCDDYLTKQEKKISSSEEK